jgi:glycosyltransferase involved in cell wall biosynthesis
MPTTHHVPVIPPLAGNLQRPLWSVMIPTYNCAHYLEKTLENVLAQDLGPEVMQIEVVDDHSTRDDPEAMVKAIAGDRVTFYRQPQNVGHVRNFNTCLLRTRGHLIHLLHGDDGVRPGFYEAMQRPFLNDPTIGAAFCRCIMMDGHDNWLNISHIEQAQGGIIPDWLERIAEGQRIQTPSMVVRRQVYEQLGGFDDRFTRYGEDWEMWVRLSANYLVWHEVLPLALYRLHTASLTGQSSRTGEHAREYRQAIEINRGHLQGRLQLSRVDKLLTHARHSFALACLRRAHRMVGSGDVQGPLVQVREALKTSSSPLVMAKASFVLGRLAWHTLASGLLARTGSSQTA